MGADFLYTTLPACKLTKSRIKKLLKLVKEQVIVCEDSDAVEAIADLRLQVASYVEDLSETVDSREVDEFCYTGMDHKLWLTGGISDGGPPTEASEAFSEIENFPLLYRQLLEWAKADFKKSKPQPRSHNIVTLRL